MMLWYIASFSRLIYCRFTLLKEHLVEFNQVAMANAEGSDDMLNRVMTKDNIGLAAMLETKDGVFENGTTVIIGHIHRTITYIKHCV